MLPCGPQDAQPALTLCVQLSDLQSPCQVTEGDVQEEHISPELQAAERQGRKEAEERRVHPLSRRGSSAAGRDTAMEQVQLTPAGLQT